MKKKCLVTGGAGFIGSWVVDYLIKKGYKVVIVDNLSTGNTKNINKKAKFYEIDIRKKGVEKIFKKEKPDFVYHLAAQINVRESVRNPIKDAGINILGTLNILNNCVKFKVKKFIFSSTGGAIYGDGCKIPTPETENELPVSPYGITKLSIEKYLHFYKLTYGLDYVALRYSNCYGQRQNSKGEAGVISIFLDKILSGEQPIINGSGEQTRDYVHVKDVAKANVMALNLSGIYNVSTGVETSVNEVFNRIIKIMKRDIKQIHSLEVKGEQKRSCLDSNRLLKKGWKVEYSFDKGIKETIKYFENLKKEEKNDI